MPQTAFSPPSSDLIQEIVLSAAANFDFQNIPPSYNHLFIIGRMKGTASATSVEGEIRVNNDSSANYYGTRILSTTGAPTVTQQLGTTFSSMGSIPAATEAGGNAGAFRVDFPYYVDTVMGAVPWIGITQGYIGGSGNAALVTFTGQNTGINTINRITIFPSSGSWAIGSRASLFGVV